MQVFLPPLNSNAQFEKIFPPDERSTSIHKTKKLVQVSKLCETSQQLLCIRPHLLHPRFLCPSRIEHCSLHLSRAAFCP